MPVNRLEIKNVYKKYNNQEGYVLNNISLNIVEGEFVSIMGRSGSGKTTLLNSISTIDRINEGCILYGNVDISKLTDSEASEFRKNEIGFVFQEYMLLDSLTVRENISVSLSLKKIDKKEIDKKIHDYARLIGIYDLLEMYPYQLSGGQKQKVSIVRAIIKDPIILLTDEPTGALDLESSKNIMQVLKNINKVFNITIVMVTHDIISACYSDRVVLLKDGKIRREIYKESSRNFHDDILNLLVDLGE